MKIASIEQFYPAKRMRLVKITTDNGLVGWGETTLEGKPRSTWAAVEELAEYLIGKDPLRIEHHWQHIYRSAFFRGGNVLMTALAGIDQALWDIAGKYYGVPVYALLGGAVRDRIRVYAHWGIRDLSEEGLQAARERLDMLRDKGGYTAFKGGIPGKWRAHEPPERIDQFVECAHTMREWVGPDVELCFDFHGKLTPALAIEVCNEIKGMRPMFVEEPVPQENVDALKLVSDHVPFPIATGERLLSRWEFRQVLEKGAAAYIQPDCSHCGGISELKRIANMAEVYYVHTMPHCAIGPVALSACLQVDAAVPNFFIQEQVDQGLGEGMLVEPWRVRDGYIDLPTRPGLGIEIDEAFLKNTVTYTEELGGEHYYESDGAVADW
ncbi:MAG TPA: galactonate dehydratase [Chloroflexi bacterium]|jgi:galactonate dehydratase|nr:galactonate dehydratase [Chloroflexota bacterium]